MILEDTEQENSSASEEENEEEEEVEKKQVGKCASGDSSFFSELKRGYQNLETPLKEYTRPIGKKEKEREKEKEKDKEEKDKEKEKKKEKKDKGSITARIRSKSFDIARSHNIISTYKMFSINENN